MLSTPDKLRANSFLNALAGNTTLVDAQHHPNSHLFVVGDFDLSHKATLKLLRKAKHLRLVHSTVRLDCLKSCTNPLKSHTYLV